MKRSAKLAIIGAAALIGALIGISASGATVQQPSHTAVGLKDSTHVLYVCIDKVAPHAYHANTALLNAACPAGTYGLNFTPGSGVSSVTGSTNITAWPESSGWATDAMVRTASVTRDHAETDVSKCGANAAVCFVYTFQLTDNGTFTTVDGKPAPNTHDGGTITGNLPGTFHGVANGTFYSSDATPDAAGFPAGATKATSSVGTTAWATQAVSDATGAKLDAYSWTYTLPCPNSTEVQQWVDAITPGDDGQGTADGNIVGCTA